MRERELLGRHFHAEDARPARLLGLERGVLGHVEASVVLPIDGRPATMIRSPGCRPAVISSRSVKPVGTPVTRRLVWCAWSGRSMTAPSISLSAATKPAPACCRPRRSRTPAARRRRPARWRRAFGIEGAGRDLGAGSDQAGAASSARARCRRRRARWPRSACHARGPRGRRARRSARQLPLRSSHSRQRHRIGRLAAARTVGDGFEDQLMIAAVEVLGDEPIGDRVPGAASSMSPPSTACSASIECGGTRISSTAALSRARRGPTTATLVQARPRAAVGLEPDLLLGDDRHRQIDRRHPHADAAARRARRPGGSGRAADALRCARPRSRPCWPLRRCRTCRRSRTACLRCRPSP